MSDFLAELEQYTDLEGSIIRATKIHKVLKAMIKLPSIPLDEEYHFRTRSHDLLSKWNEILANDNATGAGENGDESKAEGPAANTNGEPRTAEEQAEKAEAGEAAAPDEENQEKLDNKIGTTVEGEEEAENSGGKQAQSEKTAEEEKTDGPAIDSAPAEEFTPALEETVEATA